MYALWSSVFSLTKVALQYSPPFFLTSLRMLIGGLVLFVYLIFTNKKSYRLSKKQWISIILLSIFSHYLTNVLEYWALQYLSSAKVCFIYSLSPFFTAIFSYFHFGEKVNIRKILGLSLGFLGMIPVFSLQSHFENLFISFACFSLPDLAMVGAVLCSVYGWVILRLIVKDLVISPLVANSSSMLIAGILSLAHSLLVESWHPLPVKNSDGIPFLNSVFVIVLISNVICSNLYGLMLKRFTATFLSFVGLLSPIFAAFYGWVFLGESVSYLVCLSTVIVSLGLWFLYSAEIRMGYMMFSRKTASVHLNLKK